MEWPISLIITWLETVSTMLKMGNVNSWFYQRRMSKVIIYLLFSYMDWGLVWVNSLNHNVWEFGPSPFKNELLLIHLFSPFSPPSGQYFAFIRHLKNHKSGVVVLVQPHISALIMDPGHLNPPDSNEQIRAIKSVVKNNGFGKATILSHSNGTLNHGTLVRKAPEICGKHVLTDPVSWKKLWGRVEIRGEVEICTDSRCVSVWRYASVFGKVKLLILSLLVVWVSFLLITGRDSNSSKPLLRRCSTFPLSPFLSSLS